MTPSDRDHFDWERYRRERDVHPRDRRTWANRLALAVGVFLVGAGLTVVALFVIMAYALSQWGSNK